MQEAKVGDGFKSKCAWQWKLVVFGMCYKGGECDGLWQCFVCSEVRSRRLARFHRANAA